LSNPTGLFAHTDQSRNIGSLASKHERKWIAGGSTQTGKTDTRHHGMIEVARILPQIVRVLPATLEKGTKC
jgi:hypothetical protein